MLTRRAAEVQSGAGLHGVCRCVTYGRAVPAQLVTIFWRDIPAQVNAQSGRTRQQAPLPRRFQRAIDRTARMSGITTANEYVKDWRRVSRPCGDDLAAMAAAEAARLDAAYPRGRLLALATNGGWERPTDPGDGHADDDPGSATTGESRDHS